MIKTTTQIPTSIQTPRQILVLLFAFLTILFFIGCSEQHTAKEHRLEGQAIGTHYSIIYLADDQQVNHPELEKQLAAIYQAANQSMSTYQQDSEISKFNRSDSTAPVEVSADFRQVVAEGIRLHRLTAGSLDITLKPLSALWGFGPNNIPHTIPSPEALASARAQTGVVHLFIEDNKLGKKRPELALDLNTIGKGFVVDQVAELLQRQGIENYLVEIGGEMRLKGHNGRRKPWQVGVIKPDSSQRSAQRKIYPGNNGLATSGDYYQYFERDGIRYSHILNPKSGRPIRHNLASVTVIHPSSMTADGLSTGIMAMGAEKGMALAETHNLAVYFIIRDDDKFVSKMSSAFEAFLVEKTL